jgi:hypothetical protein
VSERLIGLRVLQDFLELLVWTGQLEDERPVSAIIVAPPGGGKTSMMEHVQCEQAALVGDLTARNIGTLCKNEKLTHILVTDMLSIFGHKSSTVDLTVRLISQFTGEAMKQNPFDGSEVKGIRWGLITAIPPEDMKRRKIREHIEGGGFASRFIIVRYTYDLRTVREIHSFIQENGYSEKSPQIFAIKNPAPLRIEIPSMLATKIKEEALLLRKQGDFGFRLHRHLRALVKAAARRAGRTRAVDKDVALILRYSEFFTAVEGKEKKL